MRHWSKLAIPLLIGALALVTPVVAGAASKRPPTTTKVFPVGTELLGAPPAVAAKQARLDAAGYAFPSAKIATAAAEDDCSSGARTLSKLGDRVYPEMGNGGYTSLHSDVILNYDVPTNQFLPGTKVDLQVRSTQCLSDLSFDFERTNVRTGPPNNDGPNMTVNSVEINGAPASFTFKQPTYPGNPNGQDDADPAAHAISNSNPVSATNLNPPACSPQTNGNTQNGLQCPADKLVITPAAPIPNGTTFTVTINYTGRPGVHTDGDGSTEGWFRINTTALPNDGAFVTTEPVGTDSWMPLNNHPSAKPTYDIIDTTNIGKTAIGPGELVGTTPPTGGIAAFAPVAPTSVNPPDANFPAGSWTWHWHSPEPIANYLVENSIGSYDVTARTSPTSGIQYFQAVASGLTAARKTAIKAVLDTQEDITEFQKLFAGPWPFTTNGVVVALPSVGFAEEMQTKITFGNGASSTPSAGTFHHENMHQWFGDNVAEGAFNLTFWKEGWAQLSEYFATARTAATAAGGLGTPAGDLAFENSLIARFNNTGNYNATGTFWTAAPSNPTVNNLFNTPNTYTRPGTAYLGMWRVLGRDALIATMKQIQSQYGGSSITEAQLIDVFRQNLPVKSASCNTRLAAYFTQWLDTAYATGGGLNRPQLTGPGLNGPGFPCGAVSPASPDGANGWYKSPVTVTWSGFPTVAATQTATKNGCVDGTTSIDGTYSLSCGVTVTTTAGGAVAANSGLVSETFKIDAAGPTTTATIAPPQPDGQGNWYLSPPTVTLTPSDPTSGLASTLYSLDGGDWTQYQSPIKPMAEGFHTLSFYSTDNAGNVEPTQTITWAIDLNAPVTTATLTPGLRNGWYASPELSLSVDDGQGSGNRSLLTGPCKPPYLCDFVTMVSIDGGAFHAWEPPEHFGTGNHFVQYFSKDAAGRQEATKLIAFKVDAVKPSVNITKPAEGASYPLDKVVTAAFKCTDKESGVDTCVGTVANGANIDTSTVGDHTFTVTATDMAGNVTAVTHHYTVRYTWNGFNKPINNTESGILNLAHAGDLIKLGFGLDGDRTLNVFPPGYPKLIQIPCLPWPLKSIPAAGAGATPGLSFGIASGHYTYGLQIPASLAGTCARFEIQLNDGSGTAHTADFMFFG